MRCTTLFLPEDFGRPVNFPRGDKPIPEGVARRGLVSGAGESKGVGQKESCKNKSTKPDVVQECLEAPLPITVFAEIELINGREGRGGKAPLLLPI